MAKEKKGKKVKQPKAQWSFSFLLATIGNFFLFSLVFILFVLSPIREILHRESLIAFSSGFFLMALVIITTKMSKLRVIIHEMKHAVVVILTGNKLGKIVANQEDGFVEYQMYENRLHFGPIISLAPYFFPLFSLPMMFVALIFEGRSLVVASLFLGICLSLDVCLGIAEVHPSQSDFRTLVGGFFLSKLYLVGFYLFWPFFIVLWVYSGTAGLHQGLETFGFMILSKIG